MSAHLYKVWLPLSIIAHLALIACMSVIQMPVPTIGPVQEPMIEVNWLPAAVAEMPRAAPSLPVIPRATLPTVPDEPAHAIPPPLDRPQPAPRIGAPQATTPHGSGVAIAISTLPGAGAHGPTRAPKLMTAPNGEEPAVPKDGSANGLGGYNYGESGEESGPSVAAAAKGGPNPGYPKQALEDNHYGAVILTVTISAAGSVEGVRVSRSSGYPELDDAARRAAQRWSFAAARVNGAPARDTVKLQFTFANGEVRGTQI